MSNDYKATMNLPRTDFPMRANLAQREPERLAFWDGIDVYRRSLEVNVGGEPYVLHDGPPYANGDIHMGTAYNKVMKDLVVKYKTMRGYLAPYVPGWDCHGQPIEHQVEKQLGPEGMARTGKAELRRLCREYALKFVQRQGDQFKRLGVRGDFKDPYLTLHPSYEAGNVRVFAELYRRGMVYKGSKPIHWCYRCVTALAEAEIEYGDETSHSIYVKFWFTDKPEPWGQVEGDVGVLIWTTTPWTLPANVAVTLAQDAMYVGVKVGDETLVVAEELVERIAEIAGWDEYGVVGRVRGSELAGARYRHPIHPDVQGVIVTGEHVDLSTGTGAVHTAPGHGEEDYLVGLKFDLPAPMPVNDLGVFGAGAGPFEGMHVDEANPRIVEFLRERGDLLWSGTTVHSYPHCWRCKQPVIFRATEQWFVSMERGEPGYRPLREAAMDAIGTVRWIPDWSINRISAMVADRPDWCISRQRAWGVPIPVFTCVGCGETVATEESFAAVERLFATEGADAWFTREPREYLPDTVRCERCGGSALIPEDDIVDVWFESGVSHTSVLDAREELHRPAELYLEGSDQHRGWFQSALLTSVGAYDAAPYQGVLTHGFIVDGEGRKMSKSLGNVVDPLDVVERYGADIVRLWAAASDYSQDVSVSDDILARSADAYRRIRNTFRFLLSNLYDHAPGRAVPWEEMPEVDRWALTALADLVERVTRHYDEWRFHMVHHAIHGYATETSAFYLDVLKDRLYSDAPDSLSRRSAQTVLAEMLAALVRLVAPILTFTSEEVWSFMLEDLRAGVESVQLAGWPAVTAPAEHAEDAERLREAFGAVLRVRDEVTRALEDARNAGRIGKSQEARAVVTSPADTLGVLRDRGERTLADLFIVSAVELREGDSVAVEVLPAEGEKCPRCWNVRTDIGSVPEHTEVCGRCGRVLEEIATTRS
ncbi:MAG: isoleucine--tRNA ligase [Coriobacteriia bacterium]|nr:isoleucine--tRNA ligase [Coriobacteriia bacterium]